MKEGGLDAQVWTGTSTVSAPVPVIEYRKLRLPSADCQRSVPDRKTAQPIREAIYLHIAPSRHAIHRVPGVLHSTLGMGWDGMCLMRTRMTPRGVYSCRWIIAVVDVDPGAACDDPARSPTTSPPSPSPSRSHQARRGYGSVGTHASRDHGRPSAPRTRRPGGLA